jgi:transcriptional/translational regulatory protein YebC/TACO1
MTNDAIERAIKRGTGDASGAAHTEHHAGLRAWWRLMIDVLTDLFPQPVRAPIFADL